MSDLPPVRLLGLTALRAGVRRDAGAKSDPEELSDDVIFMPGAAIRTTVFRFDDYARWGF